jgi:hypothetical protein
MLIAMTRVAQTRRALDHAPAQTLNFLDGRLKTANVSADGLPIQLIPNNNEFHGRS